MSRANVWAVVGGMTAGVAVGLIVLLLALPMLRGRETDASPPASPAPVSNPPAVAAPPVDAAEAAALQAIIEAEAPSLSGAPAIHLRLSSGV